MKEEKAQSFLKGTATLTAATFVVKFINLFFSIPLSNFLGDRAMGHFFAAYEIFIFFSVVTSSGTPVAISRMVSMAYAQGRKREADKIFRVSFLLFTGIGIVGCLVMLIFSREFSYLVMKQDGSMYAIMALAPMVFFLTLSSCLRGYFQGRSNMVPTAVSQVLESVVKLFVGIGLALYVMQETGREELAAAGAILGVSIGSFFAMAYLILSFFRSRRHTRYMVREEPLSSTKSILKNIMVFAVPVIIGSSFISALDLVDSAVMMHRLQDAAGFSKEASEAMKGWVGQARKFFDLPNAVIVPISTMVLPLLAGVLAKRDQRAIRETATLGLRMTLMVAVPAAVGLCIFAQPISDLLLYSQPEYAENTAALLMVMAPAVIAASLLYTTNSMIQAVGKVRIPIINMVIGTVVRIVLVWVLCGNPEINVRGASIATLVSYYVMVLLNLVALHRLLPSVPSVIGMAIRPLLASVVMGVLSGGIYVLLAGAVGSKIAVIIAVVAAVVIYVFAALLTKAITRDEVVRMPKGEKIAALLRLK